MIARQVCSVPDDCAGLRLDQALARMFPEHSRSRLATWLRDGRIRVDSGAAKPKQKIWGGETIELDPVASAAETASQAEDIALAVLHEDDDVLVIDKPAGLVVHPGSGNWDGTLLNALLHHSAALSAIPRAGIVHRLDKDTSGLLVVAKTLAAQTSLVRQLHERTVHREYLALVYGRVERDGEVDAPVGRDPANRVRMAVTGSGKEARTRYRVVDRAGNRAAWVELQPLTGRTHQLRVHMAAIGHPIIGDGKYGGAEAFLSGTISRKMHLHARRMKVDHPDGGVVDVVAELPTHFAETLRILGFEEAKGDSLPIDDVKFKETPEGKRRAIAHQAKDARKARRGERRGRSKP